MRQWVVDTWVLAKCNETDSGDCVDCTDFLTYLLRKGKLCLDHEEEIEAEYDRYIQPRSFLFWWWHRMTSHAGHLCRWSNKLAAKHSVKLVNDLGFDNDDIKFVGVAARSIDKLIVSGDSDYNYEVCQYLKERLGITIMEPGSAMGI